MKEQAIQKKRINQLQNDKNYVLKLISTNKSGIPDVLSIPYRPGKQELLSLILPDARNILVDCFTHNARPVDDVLEEIVDLVIAQLPPDHFVEVKRPGKKPTALQEFRMKELRNHGCTTEVYTGE